MKGRQTGKQQTIASANTSTRLLWLETRQLELGLTHLTRTNKNNCSRCWEKNGVGDSLIFLGACRRANSLWGRRRSLEPIVSHDSRVKHARRSDHESGKLIKHFSAQTPGQALPHASRLIMFGGSMRSHTGEGGECIAGSGLSYLRSSTNERFNSHQRIC